MVNIFKFSFKRTNKIKRFQNHHPSDLWLISHKEIFGAQEGYFEYGDFENCNFDTTKISTYLWLVISKKSDCNFEFNFEKVNFENVLRNYKPGALPSHICWELFLCQYNHIYGMYQICNYQLPMPVPNTETSLVINFLEIKKFEIEFEIKKFEIKVVSKLNFLVSKFPYSKLSTNTIFWSFKLMLAVNIYRVWQCGK